MPEYLSPGIYIEERNTGPRPIEGVGTAMAAFVGFAPNGPANKPILITNWSQYVETFGVKEKETDEKRNPHMKGAYLSHAVYGYFQNGGGRCYVTRVAVPETRTPTGANSLQLPSRASKSLPAFTVQPKGTPAADIEIEVKPPTGEAPPEGGFTIRVKMGAKEEAFENISLARTK